jgi:hypothetical protein
MARKWQMPFASSRGYGSNKLQYDAACVFKKRLRYVAQKVKELKRQQRQHGLRFIIYFISDHDPSGLDLQRAWAKALKNFGVACDLVRMGLTKEQAETTERERGVSLSIEVKPSDSRSKEYIEQYGDRCWETDILAPEIIERTLDAHIYSWLDVELWEQRDAEIERNRKLL